MLGLIIVYILVSGLQVELKGSHNALKRALKVSTGDLKHVVDTMELLVIKQVDEYKY